MAEQPQMKVRWTSSSRYQGKTESPQHPSQQAQQPIGQEQVGEDGSAARENQAVAMPEPFPWRKALNFLAVAAGMGVLGYQFSRYDVQPQVAIGLALLTGMSVKAGGELIGFVWRWFWTLLITGGIVASGAAGLVVTNPHCLHPVTREDEEEMATCFYLSTFAPTLPPMTTVSTGLVIPESTGQNLSNQQESPVYAFVWPSLLGSNPVQAQAPVASQEVPENFSPDEQLRFNTCLTQLYEDPALTLEAWLIRKRGLAEERAHDLIMDKLLGVCQHYMQYQIDDLRPYYGRAVVNARYDEGGRSQHFVSCETLLEMPDTCLREPILLMKGESQLFERALCNLKVDQRRLIDRWMLGGSWKEIGKDVGLNESTAANRFNSTIRTIQGYIEAHTCSAMQP